MSVAVGRRVDRRGAWEALAVPVAVFLVAELLLLLAAAQAGTSPLSASTWAHWDAGYYQQIATRGYYARPCDGSEGPIGGTCGDAAWFPGLSWLTALLALVPGVPVGAAMLLLVRLFALATLVLAWNGLLDRRRGVAPVATLALLAAWPGGLYFHALFPMSMATCFAVAALVLLRRGRYGLAGLAAAGTAVAYSTGFLIAPVLVLWALVGGEDAPAPRERIRRAFLLGIGPVVGVAVVFGVMALQTGRLDSFQAIQEHFSYPVGPPTAALWDRVQLLGDKTGLGLMAGVQSVLVVVLLVGAVVWCVRHRARGVELAATIYGVLFWLLPYTLSQASLIRSESMLLPLAIVVGRFPRWMVVGAAVLAVSLLQPMASFYVLNNLN